MSLGLDATTLSSDRRKEFGSPETRQMSLMSLTLLGTSDLGDEGPEV